MKVAVLGYGKQGKAAVDYWSKGNEITVCDQNPITDLPASIKSVSGPDYLANLNEYDLIVRSPSVHPRDIVAANSDKILRKVTTVTEEFFRTCPAPIIGVTGTKGKGTTSTLIAKIIETSGETVHLGGNIGIPPLDMLKDGIKPTDWVVLELANFQLIDLRISPKIAVCLMVVPAHLDWHTDLAEYVKAKQQLFIHQSSQDIAIFNRSNDLSAAVVDVSPALKISYEVPEIGQTPEDRNGAYVLGEDIYMDDVKVCSVADVKLLGRHNLQNVCAAIAATWDLIDNDPAVIIKALSSYTGLPHRLEPVRKIADVTIYNDSFSSEIESTIAAIKSIQQSKVLICGGYDRKLPFNKLIDEICNPISNINFVILIGTTGPQIADALKNKDFSKYKLLDTKNIDDIVADSIKFASPGGAILFSPGFASFDMFKNFEDRGLKFKEAVNKL
jgi:UDP-N-acetylmuramoylalanine--D-glutamate ligase